ncbi:MAG: hypothetical protein N3G78_03320 [Desulfobacterota bacterium]|nr:hypothetical protein [Thermodesulfobacteriota bacterium]
MDKELHRHLKREIGTLVCQEVRSLKLRQVCSPEILREGIAQSVEETKRSIVRLIRSLDPKERNAILRKAIEEAVEEEVERAIELRRKRCFRCIHGRFYDRSERAYRILPLEEDRAQSFGCDQPQPTLLTKCERFVEVSTTSLEDYLDELCLLYEFREKIEQIEELWQDYFLK